MHDTIHVHNASRSHGYIKAYRKRATNQDRGHPCMEAVLSTIDLVLSFRC